jgi:TolB-like protein
LLFAFAFAYGQQQERVAIINTLDDGDSIKFSELAYLTDRLRETAVNVLPKQRYGVMTTESIVAFLGSYERTVKECKAASCLAELGRKVSADYVAQARIGRFGENLTIKAELYSSKSGNLIGSFTGNSKDIFGLLAIIDEKAATLFKMMPSILEKARSEIENEKSYLVNISTEPPGAALSFDGAPSANCIKTPCKAELREGDARIIAVLERHEAIDTTVSITLNNQVIAMRLKPSFGILEIKPAYLGDIGIDRMWNLSINDKPYSLGEIRLSPGKYMARLGHECYENLGFEAGINKGSREVFDMAKHISLKKGGLTLNAERNGELVSEPVFVNGNQAGETPFSGSVPLCSKIEIGGGKEAVNVDLKYNEKVNHTHKMIRLRCSRNGCVPYSPPSDSEEPNVPTKSEILLSAIMLDVAGAAFIFWGIMVNNDMKNSYDEYYRTGNKYDWESVQDARSLRNILYAIGGSLLASGIGVHIWF